MAGSDYQYYAKQIEACANIGQLSAWGLKHCDALKKLEAIDKAAYLSIRSAYSHKKYVLKKKVFSGRV